MRTAWVERARAATLGAARRFGCVGRRDVVCLWTNAGRRELGLEGIDDRWSPNYRFAFVRRHYRAG
jgi:hypothetical protein